MPENIKIVYQFFSNVTQKFLQVLCTTYISSFMYIPELMSPKPRTSYIQSQHYITELLLYLQYVLIKYS